MSKTGIENPQPSFDQLFASLNEEEQLFCCYFSSSSWRTGLDLGMLEMWEISPEVRKSMIEKKVLAEVSNVDVANEFVTQHRERFEALRVIPEDVRTWPERSRADFAFLDEYKTAQRTAAGTSQLRYRLFSEQFHNWVHEQMEKNS